MTIARRIARPMLSSIFVTGGIDALRHPDEKAKVAGDTALATADHLPVDLPDDPIALVKLDAGAKIVGGLLLASGGRMARTGAVICAASLVPTTFAAHAFWKEHEPDRRSQQQTQFLKNLSLFGGLLIAALDTDGRPSVPWQMKREVLEAESKAASLGKRSKRAGRKARSRLAEQATSSLDRISTVLSDADLPDRVGEAVHRIGEVSRA
jgi:uncharacterized membrane protein YphA (DoxX/SURF4 family)